MVCRVGLWGHLAGDLGSALLSRLEAMASFDVLALQASDVAAPSFDDIDADDDAQDSAALLRFRRRPLPSCSIEDLATIDIVVLLAPWSPARPASDLAAHQVIDLTPGAVSALPTWHVLPAPVLDLSLRLLRALSPLSLCSVQICSHESAAMHNEQATRELVKETIDLLNGRGRSDVTILPQNAFNLWPLPQAEQIQLRQDLRRCLDGVQVDVQVVRLRVPVFYGLWQVWTLTCEQPQRTEELVQCLRRVGVRIDEVVRHGPVAVLVDDDAAEHIHACIEAGEDARHWVLYVAVDPLRFSQVGNLCELLQTLEKLL